jgi:hypothetical protein
VAWSVVVIALPRHLAPWASLLALFPEEIALTLGRLAIQISQLIGGTRINDAREGIPDGYDGIARRGSYDRLLASEWLVHDEVPDEFLRRAVSGEHSFLQRLHRHDASARRTIALFDTGIDQLGAPRLAHIAVLIVLMQRAVKARASLAWGILQEQSDALRTSVTEVTICELLEGRSKASVSDDDIERWLASDAVAGASEVWLIGSERLAEQRRRQQASVLSVADVLEPEAPQRIRVTVSGSRGLRPRTVKLEIPEQRAGVQLLRDPFGKAVASRHRSPVHIDVASAIVFSRDGRRLFVRGAPRGLLSVHIPNSPRATASPPVVFTPPRGDVIAVGQSLRDKGAVVICRQAGEDEVVVHRLSKRGGVALSTDRYGGMPAEPRHNPLRPLGLLKGRHLFVDVTGQVVEIADGHLRIRLPRRVIASRATHDAFVYIEHLGVARVKVVRTGKNGDLELTEAAINLPASPDDTRYYFGAVGLANLIAYSPRESRCTIIHRLQVMTFDVPRSHRVVGMVERGHPTAKPFAVAIDDSRKRIDLLDQDVREQLLTTAAPITSAAASDVGPMIAYITLSGELGVYSCRANAMVLRVAAEVTA